MENEFVIVLNSNGNYYYDNDGDVLIQRTADGAQFYVSPECVSFTNGSVGINNSQELNNNIESHTETNQPALSLCPDEINILPLFGDTNPIDEVQDQLSTESKHWTKDQILYLIYLYKVNRAGFASTTTKNIKVWQKIANHLGTHSAAQCENKFKYLKSKYLQKKDNMSQTSSGARNIKFDFFKEMDEILHKEPIVKPLSIASSRRDNMEEIIDPASSVTAENQVLEAVTQTAQEPAPGNLTGSQGTGTRKNIKLKEALNELNKILREAEAEKHKRHKELIQLQKENMKTFSELMGKIIEKM